MRNAIGILFLCLIGFNAHGQFYPEANARWCGADDDGGPPLYPVQYQMGLEPDTLIDGVVYKRIEEYRNYQYTRKYYVRSDLSGKGYAYLLDSAAEFLTGDLNSQAGDTVRDVLWSNTTSSPDIDYFVVDMVVETVEILDHEGVLVTRYYANYEGSGSGARFWQSRSGTCFGPMLELTGGPWSCMVGDTVMFGYDVNGLPGPIGLELCMMLPMPNGVNDYSGAKEPAIYPNPTTGRFTIAFPEPLSTTLSYRVYDTLGELLIQQPLASGLSTSEIDLSRFGAGSYLIKVSSSKAVWHAQVLLE